MRKTNIYEYYCFGYNYYLLRYLLDGIPVHEGETSLLNRIEEFFDTLDILDLHVTRKVAEDLAEIAERAKNLPKDAEVDASLAKEVQKAADKLDATLDAELSLRSAYIVTPKRFPLDNLLRYPKKLFASNVFHKLPNLSKFDFKSAGHCIAFGLATAAAFHIMRGTEGVLKDYYCSIVKRNRVKRLLWNNMVEHLRKRRDAPPKTLLDNLDNIRDNFRNPTQHPEARYDMDETQDLLSINIDVVNRMIKDLLRRTEPF